MAMRVPVANGSVTDLVVSVKKATGTEEVNSVLKAAADNELKGILEYCDDPIVSSDIIDNEHSCILDAMSTCVIDGNLIKVIGWYDNEWGYSNRMVDLVDLIAKI
jgi:glyceraldehyde 3-phosphate dehydrogenase